jgi:tetratricopeptide (TPR) repeat protein
VVLLASNLGDVFEVRVQTDSVIYYNQQFIKAFRAARLDSTRNWSGHPVWLATNRDWPGGLKLASILANTGLLLRHAGHLPAAFRYYEQAAALYQQLQLPSGQLWAQSPLAEAYAEQGDEPQASAAYRQALRTACALMQQTGNPSELAELLLDWYQPLLLRQPQRAGEARQLANEVEQDILRNQQALHLTASLRYTLIMARLELLRAELSLRAGQSAAELAWAAEWLEQPVVKDQRPPV